MEARGVHHSREGGGGQIAPEANTAAAADALLSAHGVRVQFGGVVAVDAVDLALGRDDVLGVIGPNGAGKTTLINALTGYADVAGGTVAVQGQDITSWPAHRRARLGVARTFQGARLFAGLTVLENVELGAVGCGERRRPARRRALELLERLALGDRADAYAGALTHGEERRVAIARALAGSPLVLLLDEPAAGLNEAESDALVEVLRGIHREFGCGVLVVEHDMRLIMQVCDRIQVLDQGRTIALGTPAEVRADPAVLEAYLGASLQAADA